MADLINDRIKALIGMLNVSQNDFAKALETSSSRISNITTGRNKPDSDILERIVTKFRNVSASWLLTGKGVTFLTPDYLVRKGDLKGEPKGDLTLREKEEKYIIQQKAITPVDLKGNPLIPLTDIKAAAGGGYINTEDLTSEDYIYIPRKFLKYKGAQHLCVRAKGQSMSPTVHDGSWLPLSLLDRGQWAAAPDKQCYVVVDNEGKTYFKRIKNRIESRGQITLMSDNPDKVNYANFDLKTEEIQSIWFVEFGLVFRLSNIHDQYYGRLDQMEETLENLVQEVAKLKIKHLSK